MRRLPTVPTLRSLRSLTMLGAAIAVYGCKSDDPVRPTTLATYDLLQVDGVELPAVLHDSATVSLVALPGSFLEIQTQNLWHMHLTLREDIEGQNSQTGPFEDRGNYVQNGTTLSLVSAVYHDTIPGSLRGDTLVITYDATFFRTGTKNFVEMMFQAQSAATRR